MPVPNIEELYNKLNNLSASYENDKRIAKEKSFMDKFGSKFSNDHNLGVALLNELDRQGIDIGAEAAIGAVDQMLDKLRTECSELLNLISDARRQVEEQAEKIEKIAEAVDTTIATNPNMNGEPALPPIEEGGEPPMSPAEGAEPPVEGGEPPMSPAEGAEPPVEGGEPPMSSAEESSMPLAEENPEEEKLPDNQTVSDARMKRIASLKSKIKPNSKPVEPKGGLFKPSAGMLAAARGD